MGNGALVFVRAWMSRRLNVNGAEFAKAAQNQKIPRASSIGLRRFAPIALPRARTVLPSACNRPDAATSLAYTEVCCFQNGGRTMRYKVWTVLFQIRRWRPKRFRFVTKGSPILRLLLPNNLARHRRFGRVLRILLGLALMIYVTLFTSKSRCELPWDRCCSCLR